MVQGERGCEVILEEAHFHLTTEIRSTDAEILERGAIHLGHNICWVESPC